MALERCRQPPMQRAQMNGPLAWRIGSVRSVVYFAAARSASTLSVRSQLNPSRPKWP